MTNSVIVLEPDWEGHRLGYVACIAEAALKRADACIWLTCAAAAASEEAQIHLADLRLAGMQVEVVPGLSPNTRPKDWLREAGRVLNQRPDSVLVVPDADLYLAALLFRVPRWRSRLRILVMRPRPNIRTTRGRVFYGIKCALVLWLRMFGSRVFALAGPSGVLPPGTVPAVGVADPVRVFANHRDASDLRSQLGLPVGSLIGLFGLIDDRKRLPDLLAGLPLAYAAHGTRLVIVGRLTSSAKERLLAFGNDDQIAACVDDYVDDEALDKYIAAVDAVALLYDIDAPSGVFARALAIGTPIILGESPWLNHELGILGGGVSITLANPWELSAAVEKIGSLPSVGRPRGGYEEFGAALVTGEYDSQRLIGPASS